MSDDIRASVPTRKPTRVLACVLCQQRKVKCDRQFPCAHCVKARVQCVPATLQPRRRRRRYPERDLIDRIKRYEELLRQNNISFDPLHKDFASLSLSDKQSAIVESGYGSEDEHDDDDPSPSTMSTGKSDRGYEPKSMWHAMSRGFRKEGEEDDDSPDEMRETTMKKAWDFASINDDHLLFGSPQGRVDLSTLHPDPVQIFRLWQVYLENVNPILKVTHTPTMQGRIIEAASHIGTIDPNLEALLFSIYSMAVLSLSQENCFTMFSIAKQDLLTRFQFGCQQALSNASFLRTAERDCLTALFLYCISVRPSTVPQSLSAILAIVIRIAQRMGIHMESTLETHSILEAEMRRRLWWALVLFDTRIGEMAQSRTSLLNPTWNCKVPINVNDADLRPETKVLPSIPDRPSEAIFVVVRAQLGDLVRHTKFNLDFTNPALKAIARQSDIPGASDGEDLAKLESTIETQFLQYCDQENPIHYMAMWTARGLVARYRLIEHNARFSDSDAPRTDEQLNIATSFALRMLECDTKVMSSRLTKGFHWQNHFHFPFPGYYQTCQDLRRRPNSVVAQRAWDVLSTNYEGWFSSGTMDDSPFFKIFSKFVLQAWEACETAALEKGEIPQPPAIVSSIRQLLTALDEHNFAMNTELDNMLESGNDDVAGLPNFASLPQPYGAGTEDTFSVFNVPPTGMGGALPPGGSGPLSPWMNQMNWAPLGGRPTWWPHMQ